MSVTKWHSKFKSSRSCPDKALSMMLVLQPKTSGRQSANLEVSSLRQTNLTKQATVSFFPSAVMPPQALTETSISTSTMLSCFDPSLYFFYSLGHKYSSWACFHVPVFSWHPTADSVASADCSCSWTAVAPTLLSVVAATLLTPKCSNLSVCHCTALSLLQFFFVYFTVAESLSKSLMSWTYLKGSRHIEKLTCFICTELSQFICPSYLEIHKVDNEWHSLKQHQIYLVLHDKGAVSCNLW